jgi:hypothetical protein
MLKLKEHLKSCSIPFETVLVILVCSILGGYSIWYASSGEFPAFPKPGKQNYYIDLGDAFLHGQVSMLEMPSSELVALKNPYDFAQRINVPYQRDYSYYRGKYFLYWGPVPGLAFAGVEAILHQPPPNALVVLISYIGLSCLLSIVLIRIRTQLFPAAPRSSWIVFILAGLVNIPFFFLLGRPYVCETAILAGQFFLFMGLLCWMMYMQTVRPVWLVFAGLGWGLALDSRYNLAISILPLLGLMALWIGQEDKWKDYWRKWLLLLVPLASFVLGLGIYNFVRFGNPLETGLTYQLTVPVHQYLSAASVPSKLYIYFLSPLVILNKFPFVKPFPFSYQLLPVWLRAVSRSSGQLFDPDMAGLLTAAPFTWLLVLGVPLAVLWGKSHLGRGLVFSRRFVFFAVIFAAAAAQLLFLLMFYYGAMRFLVDLYPLLALVMVMLVWRMDEMLRPMPGLRWGLWILVSGLAILTVVMGLLGGFDISPHLFKTYNPLLYSRIAALWDGYYQYMKDILDALRFPAALHFLLHVL